MNVWLEAIANLHRQPMPAVDMLICRLCGITKQADEFTAAGRRKRRCQKCATEFGNAPSAKKTLSREVRERILAVIDGPVSIRELADLIGRDRSSINRNMKLLVASGHVVHAGFSDNKFSKLIQMYRRSKGELLLNEGSIK